MKITNQSLELARILLPDERIRLRVHLEGQLARAKPRGGWRDQRDAVLGLVLLATGLRVSEACNLRHSDLRIGRGQRALVVRRGKGGRRRMVRIPEDLRSILRDYVEGFPLTDDDTALFTAGPTKTEPISRSTAWRRWKKALQAVGLDMRGRGCHAARHGLGIALYQERRDLRVVAAQLGHRDLRSTMVYTQPLPEELDAALDATWPSSEAK